MSITTAFLHCISTLTPEHHIQENALSSIHSDYAFILQCKSSLFSLHRASSKQGQGETAVHMLQNVRDACTRWLHSASGCCRSTGKCLTSIPTFKGDSFGTGWTRASSTLLKLLQVAPSTLLARWVTSLLCMHGSVSCFHDPSSTSAVSFEQFEGELAAMCQASC